MNDGPVGGADPAGGAGGPCPRCPALEAELDQAYQELDQAQRDLEDLTRELESWKNMIGIFVNTCEDVKERAAPILSQPSGVPRGFWSRIRGRVDVADLILKEIGYLSPG